MVFSTTGLLFVCFGGLYRPSLEDFLSLCFTLIAHKKDAFVSLLLVRINFSTNFATIATHVLSCICFTRTVISPFNRAFTVHFQWRE